MATFTINLLVLSGKLEAGLVVVEATRLLPRVGSMASGAVLTLKLPGMRRIGYMAILAGGAKTQIRAVERTVLPFETPHISSHDEVRLVATPTVYIRVRPRQPEACAVVVKLTLVEPNQFEISPKMFFMAISTILIRHACMEPLPGPHAVLQRRMAGQTFLVVDPLLPQRMARGAVAYPFQVGVRLRELARRDELGVSRRCTT